MSGAGREQGQGATPDEVARYVVRFEAEIRLKSGVFGLVCERL
jgi:hypothetical protein